MKNPAAGSVAYSTLGPQALSSVKVWWKKKTKEPPKQWPIMTANIHWTPYTFQKESEHFHMFLITSSLQQPYIVGIMICPSVQVKLRHREAIGCWTLTWQMAELRSQSVHSDSRAWTLNHCAKMASPDSFTVLICIWIHLIHAFDSGLLSLPS